MAYLDNPERVLFLPLPITESLLYFLSRFNKLFESLKFFLVFIVQTRLACKTKCGVSVHQCLEKYMSISGKL